MDVNADDPLDEVVARSLSAMTWLGPSDEATAALAMKYAQAIDSATGLLNDPAPDAEAQVAAVEASTKALYLGPHLLKTLAALGGTPAQRRALAEGGKVGSKLDELRQKRQQKEAHRSA